MASKKYENWKKGLIRKVKWAQRNRGMSDDEYRTMLYDRYQVESSTKLSIQDLEDLISHFEKLGVEFHDSGRRSRKKNPNFYEVPDGTHYPRQKRYIVALWNALGWKISGLDVRAKKQFGVDSFLWIEKQSHLQTLAKDLINRCKKKGIETSPEKLGV